METVKQLNPKRSAVQIGLPLIELLRGLLNDPATTPIQRVRVNAFIAAVEADRSQ